MKITSQLTDGAVLKELGERLLSARIARNLTQAAVAEQAGVSKRTVERIESGAVAAQLSGFVRICRVLGLLENIDALLPESTVSPIAQLKSQARKRQRASSVRASAKTKRWTWGDP